MLDELFKGLVNLAIDLLLTIFDILFQPPQEHRRRNAVDHAMAKLEPAVAGELRAALAAYGRELLAPAPTDPETLERLQALGYVESGETAVREAARLRRMAGDRDGVAGSALYAYPGGRGGGGGFRRR